MSTLYDQFWDLYGDSNALFIENLPNRRIGMTFTASADYLLQYVVVNCFRTDTLGDVTVEIWETSAGLPAGSPIASGSEDCSALGTSFVTIKTFNLSSWGLLTNGVKYAIAFRHAATGRFTWRQQTDSPPYAGGNTCYSNGLPNWTGLGNDALFQTYGISATEKSSTDSGSGSESLGSRGFGAAQPGLGTDVGMRRFGDRGVGFYDGVKEITGQVAVGGWRTVDLSSYVPANADMAFIRFTGGDAVEDYFGSRYPDGTAAVLPSVEFMPTAHCWAFAPIINQSIQLYRESGATTIFLDGWVNGGDWHGLKTPVGISASVDIWNTIRSNAYCPGAKAIIFEFDSGGWSWDVRKYGSASSHLNGGVGHGWGIIGCDSRQRWQVYPLNFGGTLRLTLYVIGFITGDDCEFLTEPPDITPASQGSYLTKEVQSEFIKNWQMSIVRVDAGSSAQRYDFRPTGSTRDWLAAHGNKKWAVVKNTKGSLSFEQYAEGITQENYLIGGYLALLPKSRAFILA
ncbi:hypothetical protein ES707_11093 [subsurface metagenome]